MTPELGHFALALAVALSFAQAFVPLWGAWRRDIRLMQAAPALAWVRKHSIGPVTVSVIVSGHTPVSFPDTVTETVSATVPGVACAVTAESRLVSSPW